jgi:hypothetical protein
LTLSEFIQHHGYAFQPTQLDGTFHEYTDTLGNKGWYIGSELSTGKITFTFGDWRKPGFALTYVQGTDGVNENGLTEAERLEFKATTERFTLEKINRQEQTKRNCQEIFARWDRVGSSGHSAYLHAKSLPPRIDGTIVKPTEPTGHVLVVPLRDEHGTLWNFQSIYDDASKQFFNFGRIDGLFFEIPGNDTTYIVEGFATGVALSVSTGARVIVAFTLSNLRAVAEKFPGAAIACDFDGATLEKMLGAKNPDPHNPGLKIGMQVAKDLTRELFSPTQDFNCKENIDFSDLFISKGKDAVRAALQTPVDLSLGTPPKAPPGATGSKHPVVGRWVNGIPPFTIQLTRRGVPILPEEVTVAEKLFSYWEGNLVKSSEGDVFVWTGKVWRAAENPDEQTWLQQIMVMHGGYGTNSRFRSILNVFVTMIPFTGQNLYAPNPYRITFNNGTLAVDFVGGKWALSFGPHSKLDYCVNLIPHDYDPHNKTTNPLFEETLKNILGDDEFLAKRRATAQLFGSCLAPVYPRLFLLVGKTGSGKSTLIILASKLVSEGNIANVQPADFQGFLMESMVGRLVNMVTDIDFVKPISDAVIKQIEDRVPILINRKNKIAVRAPFPAVHVFGANDLPPTLERGSMAHTRRWTFIPCNYFQRDITEHDKHRIDKIMQSGMQGIINFAVEGLKDLLESHGHFFVPESGREKLRKWQVENDPLASFLEAVREGGADPKMGGGYVPDIYLNDDGRCYTNIVWEEFRKWHVDAYNTLPKLPKMKFYTKLEALFGGKYKSMGHWVFRGIASKLSPIDAGGTELGNNKLPKTGVGRPNSLNNAGHKLLDNSNDLF